MNRVAGKFFHFDNNFWDQPLECGFLSLYQIGELCCEPGLKVDEHEQSVYEVSCVISGSGSAFIDGEEVRLSEGQVLINSVGHVHAMQADARNLFRYAYIGFRFNEHANGPELRALKALYDRRGYLVLDDYHDIKDLFARCMDEMHTSALLSHRLLANYCEQIVILAPRRPVGHEKSLEDKRTTGAAVNTTVYTVMQYIDANICRLPSIQEIAVKFGYNYTYLSHVFRERTGKTLQSYIAYKKTEKALALLSEGAYTATEVADILGYESVQSFSKAFLRVMGYTPSVVLKNPARYSKKYRTVLETISGVPEIGEKIS